MLKEAAFLAFFIGAQPCSCSLAIRCGTSHLDGDVTCIDTCGERSEDRWIEGLAESRIMIDVKLMISER